VNTSEVISDEVIKTVRPRFKTNLV